VRNHAELGSWACGRHRAGQHPDREYILMYVRPSVVQHFGSHMFHFQMEFEFCPLLKRIKLIEFLMIWFINKLQKAIFYIFINKSLMICSVQSIKDYELKIVSKNSNISNLIIHYRFRSIFEMYNRTLFWSWWNLHGGSSRCKHSDQQFWRIPKFFKNIAFIIVSCFTGEVFYEKLTFSCKLGHTFCMDKME
jgi:hypothetical protein